MTHALGNKGNLQKCYFRILHQGRALTLHFCHRVFKIAVTVVTWNIITNKKCVETTALLTLSCTVMYSTHLKVLLPGFHGVLPKETDLERGRGGGDRAAVNLNSTARYPQTGGGWWGTDQTVGSLAHTMRSRDEIARRTPGRWPKGR